MEPCLDIAYERSHGCLVCGVDEAGRGPLAGPVVAAAVILDCNTVPHGLNDSKKLTRPRRETLFELLHHGAAHIGVGAASVEEIDRLNILHASMLAMQRAVEALPVTAALALIDGNRSPKLACRAQTIVKGDARCLSIAAASIVAKVTRDRMMVAYAAEHPEYGFERHAGYGTAAHLDALRRHGPTPLHRRSFAPVRDCLSRLAA